MTGQLPRSVKPLNVLARGLNRLGIRMGPVRLLTVPGRRSGAPRTTPVTPIMVGGQRYVIAALPGADWAKNASAAGAGTLQAGRRREQITITEVTDLERKRAVAREFRRQAPRGVGFYRQLGLVCAGTPEEFAASAEKVRVFVLEATARG